MIGQYPIKPGSPGKVTQNSIIIFGGAWLAQSEEHVTVGLRVMSLSPTLGVEIIIKINKLKKKLKGAPGCLRWLSICLWLRS